MAPDSASIHFHLMTVYQKLGRPKARRTRKGCFRNPQRKARGPAATRRIARTVAQSAARAGKMMQHEPQPSPHRPRRTRAVVQRRSLRAVAATTAAAPAASPKKAIFEISASTAPTQSGSAAAAGPTFDELSRTADRARQANRDDEAIRLYEDAHRTIEARRLGRGTLEPEQPPLRRRKDMRRRATGCEYSSADQPKAGMGWTFWA